MWKMGIDSWYRPGLVPPPAFYPFLAVYHILPLHMPLTLFVLDAPFGRFASQTSRLNVNGNVAWFLMEIIAPATIMGSLSALPPLSNRATVLCGMYIVHYAHRAVLSPLVLSPPRSKQHIIVPVIAGVFNFINAHCLAVFLALAPVENVPFWRFVLGCAGWAVGLAGNIFHDEVLNDLRRPRYRRLVSTLDEKDEALDRAKSKERGKGGGRYLIPRAGLFRYVAFPNYLCEWFEWACFALAASPSLTLSTPSSPLPGWPSRLLTPPWMFLLFEVSAMLPRALSGQKWYRSTFGDRYPSDRKVVIPFLL